MRGGNAHRQGLHKANNQLLLASKLTFDDERAERLAEVAHRVGELAGTGRPDPEAVERIDAELARLRTDAHEDVDGAIERARDLLATYRTAGTA